MNTPNTSPRVAIPARASCLNGAGALLVFDNGEIAAHAPNSGLPDFVVRLQQIKKRGGAYLPSLA